MIALECSFYLRRQHDPDGLLIRLGLHRVLMGDLPLLRGWAKRRKIAGAQALKSAKMVAHRKAIANWNTAELPEWLDEEFFATKIRPRRVKIFMRRVDRT